MSDTKYMGANEMASYLGVARSTIISMVESGRIPKGTYLRLGKMYRFDFEAVEKHLLNNPEPGEEVAVGTQLDLDIYNTQEGDKDE